MGTVERVLGPGLAGGSVDHLTLVALAAGIAALLWVALRRSPRLALVFFLGVVCFVPYWYGITVKVYFPPACLAGLVVVAALAAGTSWRLTWADWAVGLFLLLCVAPVLVGAGNRSTVFVAVLQWGLGFVVGRVLGQRVALSWLSRCVVVVFSIVAVGAIAEFLLHWNPFIELSRPNALFQTWGTLQERGGITRSEWAFGHSISLGATLALSVPIVMSTKLAPWLRVVLTLVVFGGVVASFSRTSIVSASLGLVLSLLFLRNGVPPRLKWGLVAAVSVLALVLAPKVAGVFSAAGDEATGSANYRLALTALLPDMSVLGVSPSAHRNSAGDLLFGRFHSIDSALLLLGLTYGLLAMGVVVALFIAGITTVLRGAAVPATVAVVAQLPTVMTVALITQYGMALWFFTGLAVSSQALREPSSAGSAGAGMIDAARMGNRWSRQRAGRGPIAEGSPAAMKVTHRLGRTTPPDLRARAEGKGAHVG
jgi:hypothetical protein